MITNQLKWMAGIAIGSSLMLASCRPAYKVVAIEAYRMPMDSTWDATPDKEVLAFLTPFQTSMDSVMNEVKGEAAVSMDRYRPESPLSNLIADVLRQAAKDFTGHPADMGLINIGGIRNVLTQGPITTGNIYEILPLRIDLERHPPKSLAGKYRGTGRRRSQRSENDHQQTGRTSKSASRWATYNRRPSLPHSHDRLLGRRQ